MDEAKVNEAKQLMRSFAIELEQAAAAARSAVAASDAGNQDRSCCTRGSTRRRSCSRTCAAPSMPRSRPVPDTGGGTPAVP